MIFIINRNLNILNLRINIYCISLIMIFFNDAYFLINFSYNKMMFIIKKTYDKV
jgi:hypothetical protein